MAEGMTGVGKRCDLCEDDCVDVYCRQCNYWFCADCSDAWHLESGKTDHELIQAQAVVDPSQPTVKVGSVSPPPASDCGAPLMEMYSSGGSYDSRPVHHATNGMPQVPGVEGVEDLLASIREVLHGKPTANHQGNAAQSDVEAQAQHQQQLLLLQQQHHQQHQQHYQHQQYHNQQQQQQQYTMHMQAQAAQIQSQVSPRHMYSHDQQHQQHHQYHNQQQQQQHHHNQQQQQQQQQAGWIHSNLSAPPRPPSPTFPQGICQPPSASSASPRTQSPPPNVPAPTAPLVATSLDFVDPLRVTSSDIVSAKYPWSALPPQHQISSPLDRDLKTIGLGVRLKHSAESMLSVASIIPGGAAAESGALKVGDLVLKVDGIETQGKSVQQVSGMFLGQEFTTCELTVLRTGSLPTTIRIVRRTYDSSVSPTTAKLPKAQAIADIKPSSLAMLPESITPPSANTPPPQQQHIPPPNPPPSVHSLCEKPIIGSHVVMPPSPLHTLPVASSTAANRPPRHPSPPAATSSSSSSSSSSSPRIPSHSASPPPPAPTYGLLSHVLVSPKHPTPSPPDYSNPAEDTDASSHLLHRDASLPSAGAAREAAGEGVGFHRVASDGSQSSLTQFLPPPSLALQQPLPQTSSILSKGPQAWDPGSDQRTSDHQPPRTPPRTSSPPPSSEASHGSNAVHGGFTNGPPRPPSASPSPSPTTSYMDPPNQLDGIGAHALASMPPSNYSPDPAMRSPSPVNGSNDGRRSASPSELAQRHNCGNSMQSLAQGLGGSSRHSSPTGEDSWKHGLQADSPSAAVGLQWQQAPLHDQQYGYDQQQQVYSDQAQPNSSQHSSPRKGGRVPAPQLLSHLQSPNPGDQHHCHKPILSSGEDPAEPEEAAPHSPPPQDDVMYNTIAKDGAQSMQVGVQGGPNQGGQLLCGWLHKETRTAFQKAQKRWCEVWPGEMRYYKKNGDKKGEATTISLAHPTIVRYDSCKKVHIVAVCTGDRAYRFRHPEKSVITRWLQALSDASCPAPQDEGFAQAMSEGPAPPQEWHGGDENANVAVDADGVNAPDVGLIGERIPLKEQQQQAWGAGGEFAQALDGNVSPTQAMIQSRSRDVPQDQLRLPPPGAMRPLFASQPSSQGGGGGSVQMMSKSMQHMNPGAGVLQPHQTEGKYASQSSIQAVVNG